MKNIDILISKARISSFSVYLNDEGTPRVDVQVGLYTNSDKQISTFSASTASYCGEQFELSLPLIKGVADISKELEGIVTRLCESAMSELPQGNVDKGSNVPF